MKTNKAFYPASNIKAVFLFLVCLIIINGLHAQSQTINLWPGNVPGETNEKQKPVLVADRGDGVTRITDITDPVLKVFLPKKTKSNGAAVIVCPGGGYRYLAVDKEGYMIAEWLKTLGYTAFVLQYRTPNNRDGALQDAQRAMRIVRSRAGEWSLKTNRLGVLGFSAGGHLSARTSTAYIEASYTEVDKADKISCKPDFAILIYAAYLDKGENNSLSPEIKVDENTPPMFLFGTADDKHSNGLLPMAKALRNAKIPVELHLLPTGGHGYGMQKGNVAAETWPKLLKDWLEKMVDDTSSN